MRGQSTNWVRVLACALCLSSAALALLPPELLDDSQLNAIQQSIQAGHLSEARVALGQALKQSPSDPRLYNFLGVVDAQEQRTVDAETNFRKAIAIAPRFTGAYLNLGRLYQEHASGERDPLGKALRVYYDLLRIEPSNVEGNYQAALLLNQSGKFRPSLEYLAKLPAEAQHRSAALALICSDNVGLGLAMPALSAGAELARAPDLSEWDVLPIVPVLTGNGHGELAVTLLHALLDRGQASPAIYDQLAAVHEKAGQWQAARDALTGELETNGKPSAALLSRLAKAAYQTGDREGALGYLAHARDLEPVNPAIHFLFGLICIELKLPPEATESLQRAVRLQPANPLYNYALAAVLLQARKPEEAVVYFQNFRRLKPDDPRGRLALGVAYFEAEQTEAAKGELQAASTRDETKVGALLYLGKLASRENALDESTRLLRQAIAANPQALQPYIELGQVEIRRGQYEAADQALVRAIALAPDNYQANLNLLLLYRRTRRPQAEEQAQRVAKLREADDERERMLLRSLDIHPY